MTLKADVDRIVELATNPEMSLAISSIGEVENEIRTLVGNISEAIDDIRSANNPEVDADHCESKLTGLSSFALMSIGAEDREGNSHEIIARNVLHFAGYLKSHCLASD